MAQRSTQLFVRFFQCWLRKEVVGMIYPHIRQYIPVIYVVYTANWIQLGDCMLPTNLLPEPEKFIDFWWSKDSLNELLASW